MSGTKKGSPERQAKKQAKRAEKAAREEFEGAVKAGIQTMCSEIAALAAKHVGDLIGLRTRALRSARDNALAQAQEAKSHEKKLREELDARNIDLKNTESTIEDLRARLKAEQDARTTDAAEHKEALAEKDTTIKALNKTLRDTEKKVPTDAQVEA
jgi:hypothetical protein